MTFDELNEKSVAVKASNVLYDYFSKTFKITVTPEYGYKDEVEGKVFEIEFHNCVYVNCATTSKMAGGGSTEFIVWGKHKTDLCGDKSCLVLLFDYLSESIGAGFEDSFLREQIGEEIDHFYFENALGDAIDLLAGEVRVEEVFE